MIKKQNTTKLQMTDEAIAKQLRFLAIPNLRNKQLLRTTLNNITIDDSAQSKRHLLQASETRQGHKRTSSSFVGLFRSFVPMAAIAIVLVMAGLFGFQRVQNQTPTQISTEQVAPNGTVTNTISSINADLTAEDSLNEQIVSESKTTMSNITTAAQSFGEISNDNSF